MILRLGVVAALLALSSHVSAECVYGATDKSRFTRLDTHTILLQGGYDSDVILKTYCFIYTTSEVTVLKDDFCSYEDSVLYVDGEVCDVNQVTKVD